MPLIGEQRVTMRAKHETRAIGLEPGHGRFIVQAELAAGGMGTVCRVYDRAAGENRALKRLRPDAAKQELLVQAMELEYQVLASLKHPRIIRVHDYGVDELGPYYSMELLDGQDLRDVAPVPYRTACQYLRDVATPLALLHARRLVHRDVTPRNVRTTSDGHCKLLDFGALAPFGQSSVVVGTPLAIAPEVLNRSTVDQRADLYSLGTLAYWLLTGRQAYPAKAFADLPDLWKRIPPPPSAFSKDVPADLDALVLSLLAPDALARPTTAGEVIARLNVIGDLPPEDTAQAKVLAQSFLVNPRFTGRTEEIAELEEHINRAVLGDGGTVCIEALAGMGRTRLLEEVSFRAQFAGAVVLSVDASMYRQLHGTATALVHRLFDAAGDLVSKRARDYAPALKALDPALERRLRRSGQEVEESGTSPTPGPTLRVVRSIDAFLAEVSKERSLVVQVDNIEDADRGSLGMLAALARCAARHRVLLVVTLRMGNKVPDALGLGTLRGHAKTLTLARLSDAETVELVHSLFGEVPNAKRFADWLSERTAGSPLHAIELCRQLVTSGEIRYTEGVWTLPVTRPGVELPAALGDAMFLKIASLSKDARLLAECLSLQREQPTLKLCERLLRRSERREVLDILDELARGDVLHPDRDGFRFSSAALREALLAGMDDVREDENHRRLGEAFESLSDTDNASLRIQAGYHLIKGGADTRGADLIAQVACDSATVRTLMANLHRVGPQLEAALGVYRRQRRSVYELLPLLAALAQAGYYEDRVWGERYGDEALDVLDDISGLRAARRLRPICGRMLSLLFGVLFAVLRFLVTPRRERGYSFSQVIVHLLTTVTTVSGAASLSLDPARAKRVADTLEPFSILPERLTPVGIYQFCRSLQEIGRENEAHAYETFDRLLRRFADPRYYPTLPADARRLYIAAAHFTRATFAIFRADGKGAMESADALDSTGLKLYSMIASQLRFLYHMNRGEYAKAEVHREEVELNAAQVGSVWQVETWESPSLILVSSLLSDIVSATRIVHRLESMSRSVTTLRAYSRLAKQALMLARGEAAAYTNLVAREYEEYVPKSYIGWAATMACLAQAYNLQQRFAEARATCERALQHVTEADRHFSSLFLNLDLQLAMAEAGLGNVDGALARIDELLARFANVDHPLVQGFLYEARAKIAWAAGRNEQAVQSVAQMTRWFRPTENPILIARCEKVERQCSLLSPLENEPIVAREAALAHCEPTPFDNGETEFLSESEDDEHRSRLESVITRARR